MLRARFIPEPSGDAVDAYHRWEQDMDLAAKAGFTDYRFGIEWSRIEPAEAAFLRRVGPLPPNGGWRAAAWAAAVCDAAPLHAARVVQPERRLVAVRRYGIAFCGMSTPSALCWTKV